jgi:hypothetical protein
VSPSTRRCVLVSQVCFLPVFGFPEDTFLIMHLSSGNAAPRNKLSVVVVRWAVWSQTMWPCYILSACPGSRGTNYFQSELSVPLSPGSEASVRCCVRCMVCACWLVVGLVLK